MATEEIPCSEEERFYKLDNMLLGSGQHIRKIFARRYKLETGAEWIDDEGHVQRFIKEAGKPAFKKALPYQKRAIKDSKSVVEWDISLLCSVLGNFGAGKTYKEENAAVKELKEIRNFLAHHCTKKIGEEEYKEKVTLFRRSLHSLGMKEKDVDNLIERVGVRSSEKALEHLKDLFRQAEAFLKQGKVDQAEECYSEGIIVPSLLPGYRGEAYEKRAEFYLGQVKDTVLDANKCSNALLDAFKALELNSSSWGAHYLIARCYRYKNELSKALQHYQQALAISPGQKQVKADMDGCKVLAAGQKRSDHLNPYSMPMNLSERIAHLENETGMRMTKEEFLAYKQFWEGSTIPGQDHVFQGHQYTLGWNVPINLTEALSHYKKAAALKNAEGMYNLGLCYKEGRGVKQNVGEALRIYREVAEMDPSTPGQCTLLKCNMGVACAQHEIGVMYDSGIGVAQNWSEAAVWYTRAMENGVGNAANNLGILYMLGRGIAPDKKMAEMCWKQGVALKDANAPANLMAYYIWELEPDKAKASLKIGREMGNHLLLRTSESEVDSMITLFTLYSRCQLSKEGVTFPETPDQTFSRGSNLNLKTLLESSLAEDLTYKNAGGTVKLSTVEGYWEIEAKAGNGSVTAANVLRIWKASFDINTLLGKVGGGRATEKEAADLVDLFYSCVQGDVHQVRMSEGNVKKLSSLLAQQFEEKGGMKGNADEKIRLCYVVLNLSRSKFSQDMYAVELLKEGVKRYPNNVHYYQYLTDILGCKKHSDLGRLYAEKGLTLAPDNVDLLYSLAVHLGQGAGKNVEDSRETFQRFLAAAPADHRKVPEAFYQIACLYSARAFESSKDLEMVESYYKRGLEAEGRQLPCYLPYDSETKSGRQNIISILRSKVGSSIIENPKITVESDKRPSGVLELKPHLKSPTRKGVFTIHRQTLNCRVNNLKIFRKFGILPGVSTSSPKLQQTRIKKVSAVGQITLLEMNPTQDYIFENKCLDLTIMDDPNPHFTSIHLIAEDINGDMTRVYIYNVEKTEEVLKYFQPGCRLAIMNPYMRIAAGDQTNGIRNDEPNNIVYLEKVENMCRFCGEGNASRKCGNCKRPYCSRECQKLDWKMLDHKLICSLKILGGS